MEQNLGTSSLDFQECLSPSGLDSARSTVEQAASGFAWVSQAAEPGGGSFLALTVSVMVTSLR